MPLLRHCLDTEAIRNDTENGRLLRLLVDATLTNSAAFGVNAEDTETAKFDNSNSNTKSPKKTSRGSKGKDKASNAVASVALVFGSALAEELMHRALRTPGQAQTLALRSLASSATPPMANDRAGAPGVAGEESVRQRRDLVLTLVEVGLAGADGSLVASAARALPARPSDLAALVRSLAQASSGTTTSSKVRPFALRALSSMS